MSPLGAVAGWLLALGGGNRGGDWLFLPVRKGSGTLHSGSPPVTSSVFWCRPLAPQGEMLRVWKVANCPSSGRGGLASPPSALNQLGSS